MSSSTGTASLTTAVGLEITPVKSTASLGSTNATASLVSTPIATPLSLVGQAYVSCVTPRAGTSTSDYSSCSSNNSMTYQADRDALASLRNIESGKLHIYSVDSILSHNALRMRAYKQSNLFSQ